MPDHIIKFAEINVKEPTAFEAGVAKAGPHFLAAEGCVGVALHRVIETPDVYRLVVRWRSVEDHMVTFRQSEAFGISRACVSPWFAAPPVVTHSAAVDLG